MRLPAYGPYILLLHNAMCVSTSRAAVKRPLRALGKFSDKGWCDRTSQKALWAQGCALSAAPPAMDLTKLATATPKRVKRLSLLLVFFKS